MLEDEEDWRLVRLQVHFTMDCQSGIWKERKKKNLMTKKLKFGKMRRNCCGVGVMQEFLPVMEANLGQVDIARDVEESKVGKMLLVNIVAIQKALDFIQILPLN